MSFDTVNNILPQLGLLAFLGWCIKHYLQRYLVLLIVNMTLENQLILSR